MLFMRCSFESRQQKLTIYPFPGLKVINIRGSALLALDLIIIGNFVATLAENNRLLELSLRDYPLDKTGLLGMSLNAYSTFINFHIELNIILIISICAVSSLLQEHINLYLVLSDNV